MGLFPPRRPLHNRHGCENGPHAPHTVSRAEPAPEKSGAGIQAPPRGGIQLAENGLSPLTRQRELRKGLPRGKSKGPNSGAAVVKVLAEPGPFHTHPFVLECPDASSGKYRRARTTQSVGWGRHHHQREGCLRLGCPCCGVQHACAILRTWNPSPRSLPIPFRQARLGTQPVISHHGVPTQIGRTGTRCFIYGPDVPPARYKRYGMAQFSAKKTAGGLDPLSWPFAPSRKGYNGRAAMPFRRG